MDDTLSLARESYPSTAVRRDPGLDIAIAGLVLALFIPLAGLIVTLISRGKTERAGFLPSDLARIALVVNVVAVIPFTSFIGGWIGGTLRVLAGA